MNIEDKFFPNHGKLIIDKEKNHSAVIIDAELDPINCVFDYSSTITIDTKSLSYIVLSPENLIKMIKLIYKSEKKYEKRFAKEELKNKSKINN